MTQEKTITGIPDQLEITKDMYHGFHIKLIKPVPQKNFLFFVDDFCQQQIRLNESKDISAQTTSVWVYLSPPNLHLLSELCERGFQIHQGRGKNISVNKWIAKRQCLIPPYSLFYVGCGAILIKNQSIFLVEEKLGEQRGCFGIPNGRADPNETIPECVERQLLQQTNIKAKFKYILTFKQSTPSIFGSVDIYFPCVMELEEDSLADLKICENEINSCRWIPLKDYQEFILQNKSIPLQKIIAQYVTRLWKSGFDFEKAIPNITKFEKKKKGETLQKFAFHELITKF